MTQPPNSLIVLRNVGTGPAATDATDLPAENPEMADDRVDAHTGGDRERAFAQPRISSPGAEA
jgi:hypothetical protein